MASEISIAVSFIVGPLYSNLPRRRVDDFAIELEKLICLKIAPYWNPSHPFSGMHQRCLRVNGTYSDPIIQLAAVKSGINFTEIQNLFPKDELKVWIDPGEVSYQIGESVDFNSGCNEVKYLLKRNYTCNDIMPPYNANVANENLNTNLRNGIQYFTVSAFAKTKFGSTKLKHHNNNNTASTTSPNSSENSRPNTLKFHPTTLTENNSLPFTPDSCSSGMISPNIQRNTSITTATSSTNSAGATDGINIPCYLPWGLDCNNNTYSNLLTINIPNYSNVNNSCSRDSSDIGSVNSELNSPIHGYM